MTAEPDAHDDVAGACAAFGLTDFSYRRFAPHAPPLPPMPEPQVCAPPPAADTPAPSPMPETVQGARPGAVTTWPTRPDSGAVLPVPFGSLAARIAARRPAMPAAAPLRLVWDPAPPSAAAAPAVPQAPAQGDGPQRGLGDMFRRL